MNKKEKKIIIYLLSFLIIEIFVYIFILPKIQDSVTNQLSYYNSIRKSLLQAKSKNLFLKNELRKWEEAPKEIEIIERDYLLLNSIDDIRFELSKISSMAGITLNDINYDYEEISEEIVRIKIDFNVFAPYESLRKMIGEIEKEPRFIVLNSINLLSTSSDKINAKVSIFVYARKEK